MSTLKISGTKCSFGNPMQSGFYCPQSGRIHFLRTLNGATTQDYTGNLSQRFSRVSTLNGRNMGFGWGLLWGI